MVSMVYPAANNILLSVYRGGPQNDTDWTAIQRSGVLMAETGNLLASRATSAVQLNQGWRNSEASCFIRESISRVPSMSPDSSNAPIR